MVYEGIIIHKTAYKERDIICQLLLRDGNLLTLYCYGGRGGGKFSKGSILEVGFLIKTKLAPKRKKLEQEIHIASEWELIWDSKFIRENYKAYYFMSFIFEFVKKVALNKDVDDLQERDEHAGIFKVVSNALFFLDEAISKKNFDIYNHLFLFLIKMTYELGVLPGFDECLYCGCSLEGNIPFLFEPHNGGFSCLNCNGSTKSEETESSKRLLGSMKTALHTPYKHYTELAPMDRGVCEAVFKFLCYQFHWQQGNFISYAMVF